MRTDPFTFRFSTKYQDNESDLIYYGYRYYSASTGRWLSRDPIGEAGGINLYGFNYNDSLNKFDYLGLDPSFKELFFLNLYESVQSTSAGYTINYALFDALPRAYNAANEAVLNPYDTLVAGIQGIKNLSVTSYTIVKNGQTEAALEQLWDFTKQKLSTHEGWVDLTFGIEGILTPGGWLKELKYLDELGDAGRLCENAAKGGTTKFPNLYPAETPLPYPRRDLFFDGTKWRALSQNATTVTPNGLYNFVVQDGQTFISRGNFGRGGHLDLSRGLDVDYAGQIRFGHGNNAGSLRFWDNASGHFKPPAGFSHQAPLPPGSFQPFTP